MKCECGCGRETSLAPHTDATRGWVKGQPLRFYKGHNGGHRHTDGAKARIAAAKVGAANPNWSAVVTEKSAHMWLQRHHPKRGICEGCNEPGEMDYAFLRHPEPYTKERADYEELCRGCHVTSDGRVERRDARGRFAAEHARAT